MNKLFGMGKKFLGGGGDDLGGLSVLKQFDKNGDGSITEEDFVIAVNEMGLGSVGESAVRMAFKQLDKNGNGKLDLSEALGALNTIKSLLSKQQ